jgi:hypothetical protein
MAMVAAVWNTAPASLTRCTRWLDTWIVDVTL